jgi:hypothetical protein
MMARRESCASALVSVVGAVYLGLHRRHRAAGVRVVISAPSIDTTVALERLKNVIEFADKIDRSARKRIDRYVGHILVWPGPYSAANKWGGVNISAEYLMIADQRRLAGTLVHETTHLRIARLGVPYYASLRERIESICIREEARFLRKIPGNGENLAREVEAELESEWWTDESHNRMVDQTLKRGELPRWAARLVRRR